MAATRTLLSSVDSRTQHWWLRVKAIVAAVAVLVSCPSAIWPQVMSEMVDMGVIDRIRREGFDRSQIREMASYLTDVIGPRLTGSAAMRQANFWTAEKMREWGLSNVAMEPWRFGRGWERVSYFGRILTPFVQPLNAQPQAWTGSTNGTVSGSVVVVKAQSADEVERYRGKLAGAFILLQEPDSIAPELEGLPRRGTPEALWGPPELYYRHHEFWVVERKDSTSLAKGARRQMIRSAFDELAPKERPHALLLPSTRPYGILRVFGNNDGISPDNPTPLTELVVSWEQYGQMYRNVGRGLDVRLEINVQNQFLEDDLRAYNTLGDIRGTDKANEFVMLGAHLDSAHSGAGATDNGAGCVVMMEAVRIIRALGLQPRRTIRIALWSGEEEGLRGSRAWIDQHRDLWPRISAYINLDNGSGRIRGIWDQGNDRAAPIFEQIMWPFKDLGVIAVRHGNTGGTDHISFNAVGIPGFNFIQDDLESWSRTHHTIADTFEHLAIDDLKQAAVVAAAIVYHLATRDDMMPR